MRNLADSVALVTGGASGLGRATAQELIEAGARVVLLDLPGDALDQVAADLGDRAVAGRLTSGMRRRCRR